MNDYNGPEYPDSVNKADSLTMAKYHAGFAAHCINALLNGEVPQEQRMEVVSTSTGMFSAALLLKRFHEAAPEAADEAAAELWTECNFGDSMGERCYEWLKEWGVEL